MYRNLTVATLASTFLLGTALPALAQQACAPEKLSAAIETYSMAPFGVRAWRMLNGLGDPGLDGNSGYSYDNYQERGQWKELVASLVPEAKELAEPGYSCRLSYPLATLRERLVSLPAKDPYIKQWLMSQAVVFKACSDSNAQALELPQALALKTETMLMQVQDRAYQEASIKFYSDPPKAIELFKAIAATDSPHKPAARYNVANLLANAHNVVEARKEADAILADASLASVHDITKDLLGYIANVEDTPAGWQSLIDTTISTLNQPIADINKTERSKGRFANAMFDIEFAGVKAKQDDWWVAGTLPENATLSKALVDSARKQPMALWMMTGQTLENKFSYAPWGLIGPKWQAWNASFVDRAMTLDPASKSIKPLARLVIDGLKSGTDDASRAKLWLSMKDAAAKALSSCGDAPETAAVGELAMQAARASALAGKYDEINSGLAALPPAVATPLNSTIYPKLMQHLLTSGNVEEGRRLRDQVLSKITDSTLRPQIASFMEWVAEDKEHWLNATMMQDNKIGSTLYNFLPSSELKSLATDQRLDAKQKAVLARTAWTRDYARTGKSNDKSLSEMLALNPELAAAYDKAKKDYPSASSQHALTLTILRNPRFNMLVNSPDLFWDGGDDANAKFDDLSYYDHNDANWWCPFETDRMAGAVRSFYDDAAGMAVVKQYAAKDDLKQLLETDAIARANKARDQVLKIHPAIKAADWKELANLAKAPQAPKALAQAAVAWAKRSDGKDGAPEALALAVRATRYGCNWHGGHKAWSKPAQEMLKAKFPTSEWTTATPYWFDCQFKAYDKDGNELKTCAPMQWPKQAPLK